MGSRGRVNGLGAILERRNRRKTEFMNGGPAKTQRISTMRKAIFLDRDGVLIRTFVRDEIPHPPQSLDQVEILPGVLRRWRYSANLDFRLLVVTNQPDVARGTQNRLRFNESTMLFRSLCRSTACMSAITTTPTDALSKPAPGLLLQAAAEHEIDLSASFMVGDRGSDIATGAAAGCQTFLIERSYSRCNQVKPTHLASDLLDVAAQIQDRVKTSVVRPNGCTDAA